MVRSEAGGEGWRPITWQGWLLTPLLALPVVGVRIAFGKSALAYGQGAALILVFALIAWLTAGSPGSRWRRSSTIQKSTLT